MVGFRSTDPRLESYPFLEDELVVAIPPDHAWTRRKIIPVDALTTEPFILHEKRPGTRRVMEDRLEKAGFSFTQLNSVVIAGHGDVVREAVKAGLGVSILSMRAIQDDLRAKRLAAVRIEGIPLISSYVAILLKGKSRTPLCKEFFARMLNTKREEANAGICRK